MKLLFILIISSVFFVKCTVLPSSKSVVINAGFAPSKVKLEFQDNSKYLVRVNRTENEDLGNVNALTTRNNNFGKRVLAEFNKEVSPRRYYTILNEVKIISPLKAYEMPDPLDKDELIKLSENKYGIISLEFLELKDDISFRDDWDKVYDSNGQILSKKSVVIGKKSTIANIGWRVYDKNGDIIEEYVTTDSYFYEVKGMDRNEAYSKIENEQTSSDIKLAVILGYEYANRISPYPVSLSRNYYINSTTTSVFDEAMQYLNKNDWGAAKEHWLVSLSLPLNNKDMAKLHFNLGVYYEKAGDLENAVQELEKSNSSDSSIGARYLAELKRVSLNGYL